MLRLAVAGTGGIAAVHAAALACVPGVRLAAAQNDRPESLVRFCIVQRVSRTYRNNH